MNEELTASATLSNQGEISIKLYLKKREKEARLEYITLVCSGVSINRLQAFILEESILQW